MGKRSRPTKAQEVFSDDKSEQIIEKNRRQKKILNHNLKLKHVEALTDNQDKIIHSYFQEQNLLIHGSAGTGKSFLALYLALNDLIAGRYKKIIICRSAVSSKDLGFLPGTLEEKLAIYEAPYEDIVNDLLQRGDGYKLLKEKGSIEFVSTSFLRGLTFDNTLIFFDEAQNATVHEISSLMTRIGEGSRIICSGDTKQDDLQNIGKKQVSGFQSMIKIAYAMKSFDVIEMTINDIVRSGFVKEFLLARYNLGLD